MTIYNFQIKGHLDERWRALFDGFTITHQYTSDREPVTVLTGAVVDQSALYGILGRFRDLGVMIISLQAQAPDNK